MLKARILTAAVLLPPVLAAVAWGGPALAALLAVVGFLAGWEAAALLAPASSPARAAGAGRPAVAGREAAAQGGGATGGPNAPGTEGAAWRGDRPGPRPLPPAVQAACALGGALPAVAVALGPAAPPAAMAAGCLLSGLAAAAVAVLAGLRRPPARGRDAAGGSASAAGPARPAVPGRATGSAVLGPAGGSAVPAWAGRAFGLAVGIALWVGVPLAHALWLRRSGVAWLLVPLVILWVQDIAAFFVGRAIGRHRLAPRISPGKTWEGALGGLVGGLLAAAALARPLAVEPAALLPAALGTAVAGQAGDLFESWWKRRAGLKDSGTLLPGHGGMLDRIDSLLPALVLFSWWMRPWR